MSGSTGSQRSGSVIDPGLGLRGSRRLQGWCRVRDDAGAEETPQELEYG
jgi:hypothetical protein